MSRELQDGSAVKEAYADQLSELGQTFLAMYQAGALGDTPEDFLANLDSYESGLEALGDAAAVKAAIAADVRGQGVYATDHLELVCRVMPLIPDQDGYSYDAKNRWYLDGEPVGEDGQPAGTATAGRTLDEEKGLYYDDESWYDSNGNRLEWQDDRKLYAAGDRWYDQNMVPLTWNESNNLYYDSNETWYDSNGFPLTWHADRNLYEAANGWYDTNLVPLAWVDSENAYYDSNHRWYDQNAFPIPEAAAAEQESGTGEPEAPAPDEAVAAEVLTDVAAEVNQATGDMPDLTAEQIQAVIQELIKEQSGATAPGGA